MSRYDWPATAKRQHRATKRAAFVARTSGSMADGAVRSAREARAAAGSPLRAPEGDVNLWIPIGPSCVLNPSIGSSPRVTGRVRDIAVSPDGMRAYAASAGGGVWYSDDAGVSWSAIGNWSPTPTVGTFPRGANALTCGGLLVAFGTAADGSGDVVYVGTGEIRDRRRGSHVDKFGGVGVLHLAVPLPQALADPFGNPWKREAPNLAGRGIYRLARDPNDPQRLVAATGIGLFTRRGDFEEDREWTRVTAGPFDFDADDDKWTTDVVWSSSGRLWVALVDDTRFSDTGVYISDNGVDGPFHEIDLDGIDEPRDPRIGIAVAPNDPATIYVLASGPKLWRIVGVEGRRVRRVPKELFGSGDQSQYDLTIAVDPNDPDKIIVGGAGIALGDGSGALLFSFDVSMDADGNFFTDFDETNQSRPTRDPTFLGDGVHDDVHAACFVTVAGAPPAHLWIACDGGVFRTTAADRRQRFAACNTGLATLQCGFVANHPISDGMVFTGTQDNGVNIRIGDTIWENSHAFGGDGGCVLVHPVHSNNAVGHVHNGRWLSNGHFTPPLRRPFATRATRKALDKEDGNAAFYSTADLRQIGNKVQIALGTNRVWLADNWDPTRDRDMSWQTLPSGADPYEDDGTDTDVDTFKGSTGEVRVCRWVSDTRLVVLCHRAVLLFDRDDDDNWERKVLSHHEEKCGDLDNDDISEGPSEWVPPVGAWCDLAVYDNEGANGRFYIATTGYVDVDHDPPREFDRMDTLWWYDGSGRFHRTGLRNHNTPPDDVGTEAPAYAVIVDPDDKNIVYVGTSVGVWRGLLTFAGATPSWKWTIFSNGLPETGVHDFAFYNHRGVKLLRAALGSRGIWELDLSPTPTPVARTYLRVHHFDTRRAFTSMINPLPEDDSDLLFLWYVSPDIRIRPARGAPVPDPPDGGTVDWTGPPPEAYTHELWAFQTAFRVREPLCRPNGVWSNQFEALLRAHFGEVRIDANRWTNVVTAADVFARPWGDGEPTEVDLHELIVEQGSVGWNIPRRPVLDRRAFNVDVLVHHRDPRAVRADRVRVALLRRALPDDPNAWGNVAIATNWKTRVAQLLSGNPLPPGWVLPDGWQAAGTPRMASPRRDVDVSHPRVVTFDLNFTGTTGPRRRFVLLAIAGSDADQVTVESLPGDTLEELVTFGHHVAARVIAV